MAWEDVTTGNLSVYELPQAKYDELAREGTLDESALYLTDPGLTGFVREIARKAVTVPVDAWTESDSRFEAVIRDASIRADTDVDLVLCDAQKGAYALGCNDPVAGGVTVFLSAAPEQEILLTMVVREVMEV